MNWNPSSTISPSDEAVVVLLAGVPQRVSGWSQYFTADTRFRVCTFATDAQDLIQKIATYNPEAILLDAMIFSGPAPLAEFLTRVQGAAYLVLPQGVEEAQMASFRQQPCVKGVFIGDVNLVELAPRIAADCAAQRRHAPALTRAAWNESGAGGSGGVRVISVWNRIGGCGKSTIAASLALDAAQRGLKTLLLSLSVPDMSIPAMLGLKTHPNLSLWLSRPSLEEGLLPAVQKVGELDVVVGLQDSLKEKELLQKPEDPGSINALAISATYGGYAVVIFDTPVSLLYPAAISSSNTLVLPATPTVDHAMLTAESYRVVFKKLSGQHRVGAGNVYLVLNRARGGLLSANEWHQAASTFARAAELSAFPPVAASIPELGEVGVAANAGRSPLTAGVAFARPIHKLGDALFGTPALRAAETGGGRVIKIGPLRIRKGRA